MATHKATDLMSKPRHMAGYGDAVLAVGDVVPAAAALNDVIQPCVIPAGSEVSAIILANADLDSNGAPALAFKMGFRKVSSNEGNLTDDDDYFVAAGDTTLQSANNGKVFANFAPIKFEQDVFLELTITAGAATFASGAVRARVLGQAEGVK